jgi:hypothetical protein
MSRFHLGLPSRVHGQLFLSPPRAAGWRRREVTAREGGGHGGVPSGSFDTWMESQPHMPGARSHHTQPDRRWFKARHRHFQAGFVWAFLSPSLSRRLNSQGFWKF